MDEVIDKLTLMVLIQQHPLTPLEMWLTGRWQGVLFCAGCTHNYTGYKVQWREVAPVAGKRTCAYCNRVLKWTS